MHNLFLFEIKLVFSDVFFYFIYSLLCLFVCLFVCFMTTEISNLFICSTNNYFLNFRAEFSTPGIIYRTKTVKSLVSFKLNQKLKKPNFLLFYQLLIETYTLKNRHVHFWNIVYCILNFDMFCKLYQCRSCSAYLSIYLRTYTKLNFL